MAAGFMTAVPGLYVLLAIDGLGAAYFALVIRVVLAAVEGLAGSLVGSFSSSC